MAKPGIASKRGHPTFSVAEASRSKQGSYRHMASKQRKPLGRYMVADPEICHGKPTFLGTRIMVAQVLKQVAKDMPWDTITAEWRGAVTKDAIAEAVELAQRTDRKSTRLNSSHLVISYAVFCLK